MKIAEFRKVLVRIAEVTNAADARYIAESALEGLPLGITPGKYGKSKLKAHDPLDWRRPLCTKDCLENGCPNEKRRWR